MENEIDKKIEDNAPIEEKEEQAEENIVEEVKDTQEETSAEEPDNVAETIPTADTPNPEKKKKKKHPVRLLVILLLLASAAGGVVIHFGFLKNFFMRQFMSPEKYYAYIEEKALDRNTGVLSAYYENLILDLVNPEEKGHDFELRGKFGDAFLEILKEEEPREDYTFMKDVELATSFDFGKDYLAAEFILSFLKTRILSGNLVVDFAEEQLYVSIPEMSGTAACLDFDAIKDVVIGNDDLDEDSPAGISGFSSFQDKREEIYKALPSKEELAALQKKYGMLVVSCLKDVTKEKETISVEEISQKCTALIINVDEETAINITKLITKEMSKDKEIKKIICDLVSVFREEESEEIYEEFLDLLEKAEEEADDINFTELIQLKVFVDNSGNVIGREFIDDVDEMNISWVFPRQGSKFGVQVKGKDFNNKFYFEGSGEHKGTKLFASAVLTYNGKKLLTVEASDLDGRKLLKGLTEGKFVLSPSRLLRDKITEEGDVFTDPVLAVTMKNEEDEHSLEVELFNENKLFASLFVKGAERELKKLTVPKDSMKLSFSDEENFYAYAKTVSLSNLIQNLKKVGFSEDFIESLEEFEDQLIRLREMGDDIPSSTNPYPTEIPQPTEKPEPTLLPSPTDIVSPTDFPYPSDIPYPTESPYPTDIVYPTGFPYPSDMPYPTGFPSPTDAPFPTEAPAPSATPYPEPSPLWDLNGDEYYIGDWWSMEEEDEENLSQAELDALAYRQYLMKRCNFSMTRKAVSSQEDFIDTMVNSSVAGSPAAHLFELSPELLGKPMLSGILFDLSTLSSLDFDEAKWNQTVRSLMTRGNSVYGMRVGYNSPRNGVIFSKYAFEMAGLDPSLPYQLQRSGNWTWSEFEKLCSQLTRDTNNDGITDIYAISGQSDVIFATILSSARADLIGRDESGKLFSKLDYEECVKAMEFAQSLYDKGYVLPQTEDDDPDAYISAMYQAYAAMQFGDESYCEENGFYDLIQDELGFVVGPKRDGQENYAVTVYDSVCVMPFCFSEEEAEKIAYAYNLYTEAGTGYETAPNPEKQYFSLQEDRTVEETLRMYNDPKNVVPRYSDLCGTLDISSFLSEYPFLQTSPVKKVLQLKDSWSKIVDRSNNF